MKLVQLLTRGYRKYFFGTFLVFGTFFSGMLDHLYERPFEEFEWPADATHYAHKFSQAKDSWFDILPRCELDDSGNSVFYIFIKSAVNNAYQRDAIRDTWGKKILIENHQIIPIFVIGRFRGKEHKRMWPAVKGEAEAHGDLLAISTIDSYRNNTYKFVASIFFANNHFGCPSPDFALLIDEDYMLNVENLVDMTNTREKTDPIYEGWVFYTSPFRFAFHKHTISLEEYPFDEYPPYVSAGAVFLSQNTIARFARSIPHLKIFPFDDIYAGIVAKTSYVAARHNENFVFWKRNVDINEWKEGLVAAHGFDGMLLRETYKKLIHAKIIIS